MREAAVNLTKRLAQTAQETFADFEEAVERDATKTAVLDGTVHPLTSYVINYVKFLYEWVILICWFVACLQLLFLYVSVIGYILFQNILLGTPKTKGFNGIILFFFLCWCSLQGFNFWKLSQIPFTFCYSEFLLHWTLLSLALCKFYHSLWMLNGGSYQSTLKQLFQEFDPSDPEAQLASVTTRIMQALQNNLDGKSKQYKDPALTQLFLMNNIHYIVRSVRRLVVEFSLCSFLRWRFYTGSIPFCILYLQVRGEGHVRGWLGANT